MEDLMEAIETHCKYYFTLVPLSADWKGHS